MVREKSLLEVIRQDSIKVNEVKQILSENGALGGKWTKPDMDILLHWFGQKCVRADYKSNLPIHIFSYFLSEVIFIPGERYSSSKHGLIQI